MTILGLDPFPGGRYATYVELANRVRAGFANPDRTLKELFSRIVFSVMCGNTDDHGRNHAAFVDEAGLALTPAYDICPQARTGNSAAQAMAYGPDGQRSSRLEPLIDASHLYHLDRLTARQMVAAFEHTIRTSWNEVCDLAALTEMQRNAFFGGQFLNPFIFE